MSEAEHQRQLRIERQRRYRQRRKRCAVARIEYDKILASEALIDEGRIDAWDADNKAAVETALQELLHEWVATRSALVDVDCDITVASNE